MSEGASDIRSLTELAVASARRAGASAADAVLVEYESSSVTVRLGEVEKVKSARERRLGLRCFHGQSSAVASTADLAEPEIAQLARAVVDMARVVAPDPDAGLPPADLLARSLPDLGLADPDGILLTGEKRIDIARRCEAAALAADPRLQNSEGADFQDTRARTAYASSAGFCDAYETSGYALSVSPIAREGNEMQRDYWFDRARVLSRLASPEEIGRIAADRTLRRLGARKLTTRDATVVFDPLTAASLLGHVASALSGPSLYRRASFLLDRLGDVIASPEVQIIDDGRLRGGLGSRPFDAEGVATRRTAVIEGGILTSYLLDTYAARKLGHATTGNAARGVGDVPFASPTNLSLAPGVHTPEDIVGSVDSGLLVTSLSGFGVNGVTGDYSRGASGLWIERGKPVHPVEEVTIAGNLLQMLRDIEMIGSDLVLRGTISAPTIRIRRMTVAGS
jgi:PmbA protein